MLFGKRVEIAALRRHKILSGRDILDTEVACIGASIWVRTPAWGKVVVSRLPKLDTRSFQRTSVGLQDLTANRAGSLRHYFFIVLLCEFLRRKQVVRCWLLASKKPERSPRILNRTRTTTYTGEPHSSWVGGAIHQVALARPEIVPTVACAQSSHNRQVRLIGATENSGDIELHNAVFSRDSHGHRRWRSAKGSAADFLLNHFAFENQSDIRPRRMPFGYFAHRFRLKWASTSAWKRATARKNGQEENGQASMHVGAHQFL